MAIWRINRNIKAVKELRLAEQVKILRQQKEGEFGIEKEIPGMREAITAISESIKDGEKIAVFGDYDCDGICGSYILKKALEKAGAKATVVLPTREEGYGIKPGQVKKLKEMRVNTIITVDNGITAFKAVRAARELGLKIIVMDHHEPKDRLPDCIVVNPKLRKDRAFRDYSGAGVAYKLGELLLATFGLAMDDELKAYASLATVVDMMPIVGPNFDLAREGLLIMRSNPPAGIKALMDTAGIKKLDGFAFGWQIGPRINSAGRLADPMLAYRLIEADDPQKARKLALILDTLNRKRQAMIEEAVKECLLLYDGSDFPFFVTEYPHGIAGIIAGRLADIIKRPVLVGSNENGMVRASGRSVGDFSILSALDEANAACGLPESYGGHAKACGLQIDLKDIPKLAAVLDKIAKQKLKPADKVDWIDIDGIITDRVLTADEIEELDEFEPCGVENPEPVFIYSGVVESVKEGNRWQLVKINDYRFFADPEINVPVKKKLHIAVKPYLNEHNGSVEVMFKLFDIKENIYTKEAIIKHYKACREGNKITDVNIGKILHELMNCKNLLESPTFRECGIYVY